MVQLQPRLPKFRKKEEYKGEEPEKSRKLLWFLVAVVIVVVVLVVVWAYSVYQPKSERTVSDSDVRAELERLQGVNSEPRSINPADYPKVFGIYWRNNLTLVEQYFCSDVCPDYGRVDLVYKGIDNEECLNIGGNPLHDLAWGGYLGCQPKLQN